MNKRKNSVPSKAEPVATMAVSLIDRLALAAANAGLSASALHGVQTWLVGQLMANQYARLIEGGHVKGQIPLQQVFVDLPIENARLNRLFLKEFMQVTPLALEQQTASRLAAKTIGQLQLAEVVTDGEEVDIVFNPMQAVLLIGGPGQGKSTLVQWACQLHRASLLLPTAKQFSVAQQEVLLSFAATPQGNNLPLPPLPALPLQISLPELAVWLSKPENQVDAGYDENVDIGILQYLCHLPIAKTVGLVPVQLLALMPHLSCLLVLDGFDEVGAEQDRQRLVAAITQLLNALRAHNIRAQILATTRPQGYAEELAQIGVPLNKINLVPLSTKQAMDYAGKLLAMQFPIEDQRHAALARLEEAAKEPSTQRLLTTPLQVTILTALLEQLGRVPKERWKLFFKYYDYTFNREVARNSYASRLLSDHRGHIEQIHMRVALLLQVEAERDGGNARMSRVQLNEVIETVLAENEIAAEERAELVRDLAVAAEQRLVFLVEPEPGNFGFEIRSLQEFWTAWALSCGRDEEVEARLQQIADAPMFRNVLLFLASKFFSDAMHFRDYFIKKICADLNEVAKDPVAGILHAGAVLALEALEEGSALGQPKQARALMACACGFLDLPFNDLHWRLLDVVNADTETVLQTAMEERISTTQTNLTAWLCVVALSNSGCGWARHLGDKHWAVLPDFGKLLEKCEDKKLKLDAWLTGKIIQHPELAMPMHFWSMKCVDDLAQDNWVSWFCSVYQILSKNESRNGNFLLPRIDVLMPLPDTKSFGSLPQKWELFLRVVEFNFKPTAQSLAEVLVLFCNTYASNENFFLPNFMFLWPLGATNLYFGSDYQGKRIFSEKLKSGESTNILEWRMAEEVEPNLLRSTLYVGTKPVPFDVQSLEFGIPFFAQYWDNIAEEIIDSGDKTFLHEAVQILKSTHSRNVCGILVLIYCRIFTNLREEEYIFNKDLPEILSFCPSAINLLIPKPVCLPMSDWLHLLDTAPKITWAYSSNKGSINIDSLTVAPTPIHQQIIRFVLIRMNEGRSFSGIDSNSLFVLQKKFTQEPERADIGWTILQTWLGILPVEKDNELPQAVLAADVELDAAIGETPFHLGAFLRVLNEDLLPTPRIIALLLQTYALLTPDHEEAKEKIIRHLRSISAKNKSGLENPAIWQELALPAPAPQPKANTSPDHDTGLLDKSIAIQALELKNIRGFTNLKVTFNLPPTRQGQWIVFLGQNGVGKTTLLRSLALALRNEDDNLIWPESAFLGWPRTIGNSGALEKNGWIKTTLADGKPHQTIFTTSGSTNGSTIFRQDPKQRSPSQCLLIAYGCRRGSATGGPKRDLPLGKEKGTDIATLFEEFAGMVHAETWLTDLKNSNPILLPPVLDAIKTFLDVEVVEFSEGTMFISEKNKPKLKLDQLSDGYLTSAGWFIDLLARWIYYARREGRTIELGFMSQMRGLVLIDEIDMHLHPRWQIEIIRRTRKLMPQMSFIVTTHNPLTLVGAKAEEIWVLENHDGKITAQPGTEAPMLLTGGQIYTRYFGIEDIYPDGLGSDMQRYHFLSRYTMRNEEEDAELATLRTRLDEAGILPDWPIVATVPRKTSKSSQPAPPAKPPTRRSGAGAKK